MRPSQIATYNRFKKMADRGEHIGYVGLINMGQKYELKRLDIPEKYLPLLTEEEVSSLKPEKYDDHFYLGRCCQFLLEVYGGFVIDEYMDIIEFAEIVHSKNRVTNNFSFYNIPFVDCECGEIPTGEFFQHRRCKCGKYRVNVIAENRLHLDSTKMRFLIKLV